MTAFVLALIAVASVLVVSGIAKLRDPSGSDAAFSSLKVPKLLSAPWLRRALPWVEIGLGVLLLALPGPANAVVAVCVLMLFLAYTWLIARALVAKDDVDCNCFGALTSGRVTRWTLARNATLLVLSGLAIVDALVGEPAILRALRAESIGWVALAAAIAFLVFTITRTESVAPTQGHAAAGSGVAGDVEADEYERRPNPAAVLLDAQGAPLTLASLTAQRAVLLIWVSVGCGPCNRVIPQIAGWRTQLSALDVRPVISRASSLDGLPEELQAVTLVDPHDSLGGSVKAFGTPSAVLFGADGLLAGGPVSGPTEIEEFVSDIAEQLAAAPQPSLDDIAAVH